MKLNEALNGAMFMAHFNLFAGVIAQACNTVLYNKYVYIYI